MHGDTLHSTLINFLRSPHIIASPDCCSIESPVYQISGLVLASSPFTISDSTVEYSAILSSLGKAPLSEEDLEEATYTIDMLSFRWRLNFGRWYDKQSQNIGQIEAVCSSFQIAKCFDLPIEIDMIPPCVTSEASIDKLIRKKLAACTEDLFRLKADQRRKARESFEVEKIRGSKVDLIDAMENSKLKTGLSILDLLNTESKKPSPVQPEETGKAPRERSRSKSKSKRATPSVIVLSSDEEKGEGEEEEDFPSVSSNNQLRKGKVPTCN